MHVIYLPEELLNKLNFDCWCVIDSFNSYRKNRLLIDEKMGDFEFHHKKYIQKCLFQKILEQMSDLNLSNSIRSSLKLTYYLA